jgi:hypothetical protein
MMLSDLVLTPIWTIMNRVILLLSYLLHLLIRVLSVHGMTGVDLSFLNSLCALSSSLEDILSDVSLGCVVATDVIFGLSLAMSEECVVVVICVLLSLAFDVGFLLSLTSVGGDLSFDCCRRPVCCFFE